MIGASSRNEEICHLVPLSRLAMRESASHPIVWHKGCPRPLPIVTDWCRGADEIRLFRAHLLVRKISCSLVPTPPKEGAHDEAGELTVALVRVCLRLVRAGRTGTAVEAASGVAVAVTEHRGRSLSCGEYRHTVFVKQRGDRFVACKGWG